MTTRTWLWGEHAVAYEYEAYSDTQHGSRLVYYFDKSRMEVTDPLADRANPWYVTNGLLVRELITGQMQVGHAAFEPHSPADVNVAGDPDDPGAPTYASFGYVLDAPPTAAGSFLTRRLARHGSVSDDPALARWSALAGATDDVTRHAVAAPFWAFMTAEGLVTQGGELVNAPLFVNPYYATGRPISEAYWANVKVANAQKDVLIQCRAEFGDELVDRHGELKPMPPERTFRHFISRLKAENKVALTKLTNPDKYRSHYALTGSGAFAWVKEPNQLWQIDASPVDALCVDGRHSIYLCIDLATRRIVITLSKTPRASAVGLMIRKAILAWGVAEKIKTDNGSDFVAKETTRLFAALGIEVERSHAFSPQEKGHVERAIKTFQHGFCPKLPGYIGHDVADRKEIEARRSFALRLGSKDDDAFAVELTAAQLQRRIDEWVEYDYAQAAHSGLDGLSPAQAAERSMKPIRRVNEHALDVLLMPLADGGGIRTMGKKGLKIGRRHYQAPEIMPGTKVLVRMDPMDAGRARVFSAEGDVFLADAVCAELAGLDPATYLKAARAQREARIAETTRPARDAVRHLSGTDIIDRHLEVKKRDASARAAGNSNVIRLPKRTETHSTPQIEAAAESTLPMPVAPLNPRAAEIQRQLLEDINAPALRQRPAAPQSPVEEAYERFRRALRLEEIEASGQPLSDNDARWLAGYREGPEYSAMRLMRANFGEAMGF